MPLACNENQMLFTANSLGRLAHAAQEPLLISAVSRFVSDKGFEFGPGHVAKTPNVQCPKSLATGVSTKNRPRSILHSPPSCARSVEAVYKHKPF